jgi:hypothetical protein
VKRRIAWVAEFTEELTGRQVKAEVAQIMK